VSPYNYEDAARYALDRLRRELSPDLFYHGLAHTQDEVVPAVERLAALAGVRGEDLLLVLTAAHYHDLGYVERYVNNEPIGARIAAEVLPGFGYPPAAVRVVGSLILATRLPQSPRTLLEQILADADLDTLGREVFLARSDDLRRELETQGIYFSSRTWYEQQLAFLRSHRYFTDAARGLRDAGQRKNEAAVEVLLAGGLPVDLGARLDHPAPDALLE
jgi:uncharacterized protein